MKKLNVTPGEWSYQGGDNNSCEVNIGDATATITRYDKNTGENVISREEMEANAILIADAGTTYNKCGKLPSELELQNRELIEALKDIVKEYDLDIVYGIDIKKLRALLTKIENNQ